MQSKEPLHFRGQAHPRARDDPECRSDLSAAEISCTQLGRGDGLDLLVEHDWARKVGTVDCSWENPRDGSLRVAGRVTDADTIDKVRSGELRGLSLRTNCAYDAVTGATYSKRHEELSVCNEPRRPGCYIDEIDGRMVSLQTCASARRTTDAGRYQHTRHL